MDGLSSRELLRDRRFVVYIAIATVIGKQRHFVISGEVPQNIEGTNLPAAVDRPQFPRFNPENFHCSETTSTALHRLCRPRADAIFQIHQVDDDVVRA